MCLEERAKDSANIKEQHPDKIPVRNALILLGCLFFKVGPGSGPTEKTGREFNPVSKKFASQIFDPVIVLKFTKNIDYLMIIKVNNQSK